MPGTLYVVATPIGNLEDITRRALRVLADVRLIAAEDTRRTAGLLHYYGIRTPTTSFHEHNERRKTASLLARLDAGEDIALVTDAGTPGVSDPGTGLIRAAIARDCRVEPVPGPSALLAALVGSGLDTSSFTFMGFPPSRAKARSNWFSQMAKEPRTVIFFEAPHRIRQTLELARTKLGDRPIAVARELTKIHEEWARGPISTILEALSAVRGEFTVVVQGAEQVVSEETGLPEAAEVRRQFCHMTEKTGLNRRQALSALARRYRAPTREVFRALEEAKK